MLQVRATSTDYNQLATGTLSMTAEEWLAQSELTVDDIVGIEGNEFIAHAEWGNGEGYDEYRLSFVS